MYEDERRYYLYEFCDRWGTWRRAHDCRRLEAKNDRREFRSAPAVSFIACCYECYCAGAITIRTPAGSYFFLSEIPAMFFASSFLPAMLPWREIMMR